MASFQNAELPRPAEHVEAGGLPALRLLLVHQLAGVLADQLVPARVLSQERAPAGHVGQAHRNALVLHERGR